MIHILVVDDHPILREGLIAVLEDQSDFKVIGSAGTAADGARLATELSPDVVLLDLEMPDTLHFREGQGVGRDSKGSDSVATVLASAPKAAILVFTAYGTDEVVISALRAGAKGYLLKGASADELSQAIRAVAAGQTYLTPRVATALVAQLAVKPAVPTLSAREREVLGLISKGLSNKQAAHTLSISEATIKFHVTSILTKLNADNRAQAVSIAVQQGLL